MENKAPNAPLEAAAAEGGEDPRRKARYLYWAGWRVCRIAEFLHVKDKTVFAWKYRDQWDAASSIERVDGALEARMVLLLNKEEKEGKDYKEIDLLGRQLERTARVKKYLAGGNENDLNPNHANKNKVKRVMPEKNVFSPEDEEKLAAAFEDSLFDYQRVWYRAGETGRIRNILKARQIGATWYFAREALVDAVKTGRNQIFLSASKAQSHVFRQYILQFAQEACGIELRGSPLVLANGASLYFLSNNSRTAQSYHGNLYFDEYFWVQNFSELRKVASGMAIHARWRQTYFSTPSSVAHPAHAYWSGALFNKGRKKEERVGFDVSHGHIKDGASMADGQWRQMVTVEDAVAGGCDLFDLAQLRQEYSPEEYSNLLMCQFIDDTMSVFPLSLLLPAMVDSWALWEDFSPFSERPFGEREVWLGYDPSVHHDASALVAVSPPMAPGGKFRILEKHQWRGMDFQEQADGIKAACARYHVSYIGIDVTGIGNAVYQLVKAFYPAVEAIHYNVEKKNAMVLKGLDVFSRRRLEFEAGWQDVAQSFMAIRKTMTESGRQMTFKADRSAEVSHADLAWATLHALSHEPLAVPESSGTAKARIELFG